MEDIARYRTSKSGRPVTGKIVEKIVGHLKEWKLKQVAADLTLDNQMLQEVLQKKGCGGDH